MNPKFPIFSFLSNFCLLLISVLGFLLIRRENKFHCHNKIQVFWNHIREIIEWRQPRSRNQSCRMNPSCKYSPKLLDTTATTWSSLVTLGLTFAPLILIISQSVSHLVQIKNSGLDSSTGWTWVLCLAFDHWCVKKSVSSLWILWHCIPSVLYPWGILLKEEKENLCWKSKRKHIFSIVVFILEVMINLVIDIRKSISERSFSIGKEKCTLY